MTIIPKETGWRSGPRNLAWLGLSVLAFLVLSTESSRGQTPDPRPSIARDANPVAPAFDTQTRGPMEGDQPIASQPFGGETESDLFGRQRILVERPVYDPWSLFGDAGIYRTDNVALSPANELEDTYFRLASGFTFDPQMTSNLFGHVHFTQAFYLYDRFDVLDFDFLDTGIGLNYYPGSTGTPLDLLLSDARLFLDYAYDRTSESGFGSAIFDNHALLAGWQKMIPLNRTQLLILGYTADLSLDASSDLPRRHEHVLSAAYRVQWSPRIFTTLAWQSAWHDYFAFGREDWNHGLSFLAECQLTDRATLYGSASWLHNASNLDVFDYDRFDFGGVLGIRIPFGGRQEPMSATGWSSSKNPLSPEISK